MKSEDIQKVVLLKYQSGEYPTKIFRDLHGALDLTTFKRWCKMIDETALIELSRPPGRFPTVRTKTTTSKVKKRLEKGKVSSRKLAIELGFSRTSARRILKEDLGCRPYTTLIEPAISHQNKVERKYFAN